jgi:hypothetical protein
MPIETQNRLVIPSIAIAAVIFVLDIYTPLGVAGGVP